MLVVAAVAFSAACNRGDRAQVDSAVERAGDVVGAAADTVAGRVAGREYSNAELIGFVNAYNDAEIEMGELAQPKATDAQVKAFARQIVTDHRALKTEVSAAGQRLGVTPTVPEDDEDLREDHQEGMRELREQARGREFDEKFLEHEIAMHRKVLDEIEDALGRNPGQDMRAVLERARTGVQAHLTAAQELEKKF